MKSRISAFSLVAVAFASIAFGGGPRIAVSIPPYAGLACEIAGPEADVSVALSAGGDPHVFEPSPRVVASLRAADVVMLGDFPFEARLAAFASGARRVDFPGGGDGDEPHGWLSASNLVAAADALAATLSSLDPGNATNYAARAAAYRAKAAETSVRARTSLAGVGAFAANHPAYSKFAEEFGLVQVALEEHGHEPGPRRRAETSASIGALGVKVMVLQSDAERARVSKLVEEHGLRVAVVPPLGRDALATIDALAAALSEPSAGDPE